MEFRTFRNQDGSIDCIINMDSIIAATPSEEGKLLVHADGRSFQVDERQFMEAIEQKQSPAKEFGVKIERLIQAMDRMTVHFPTSIRMHM